MDAFVRGFLETIVAVETRILLSLLSLARCFLGNDFSAILEGGLYSFGLFTFDESLAGCGHVHLGEVVILIALCGSGQLSGVGGLLLFACEHRGTSLRKTDSPFLGSSGGCLGHGV